MKNKKLLFSFIWYCLTNGQHMRFWQALAAWSQSIIYQGKGPMQKPVDTFYMEVKNEKT